MQLASKSDVQAALGRDLSEGEAARIEHLLDLISAKFEAEARCSFTKSERTHRVKVNGGQAYPPIVPIQSVQSVVDDDGLAIPFRVRAGAVVVDLPSDEFVTVTYTSGLDKVPDRVRLQVADSVARLLRADPRAAAGQTQASTTTGPFSESSSFAAWTVGGQGLLSPDDLALARSYRPRRVNVWVGGVR
ncbi:hypothetical protein I6B53_03280 [Schaalia sp. 19OD2882]|uniref:hypothetical protein n=1 Tax=Schaalia sp. 19OD2882 TaxID=2794089 RepID=UPI001C1EA60C|nr:hypothetical protein [Schaalia sp. 19OD2882]QWW20133.1 hypothetical protein I6B53_03280 [Schaalia sp. 19OD2882]